MVAPAVSTSLLPVATLSTEASINPLISLAALALRCASERTSDADEVTVEAARLALEAGLDAVHARAYELVGGADPGAGLREKQLNAMAAPGTAA